MKNVVERSTNKVINCHWFGGSDKLPTNTIYIGRPSPFGNSHSSKSGLYTKEECIALHRVDLYHSLIRNPLYFPQLKQELYGHDLACWCKQHKRLVGCHGDNYLHIFSEPFIHRTYDRTIVHYLMEDVRTVLSQLDHRICKNVSNDDFLFLFIHFGDVRLDIQHVLRLIKENFVDPDDLNFFLAYVIIDLELAYHDSDLAEVRYRFDHVHWVITKFIRNQKDRDDEPISPHLSLKKPSKKRKEEKRP